MPSSNEMAAPLAAQLACLHHSLASDHYVTTRCCRFCTRVWLQHSGTYLYNVVSVLAYKCLSSCSSFSMSITSEHVCIMSHMKMYSHVRKVRKKLWDMLKLLKSVDVLKFSISTLGTPAKARQQCQTATCNVLG